MGIIKKIILYFKKRKEEKERKELYKKKLAELRKRDLIIKLYIYILTRYIEYERTFAIFSRTSTVGG